MLSFITSFSYNSEEAGPTCTRNSNNAITLRHQRRRAIAIFGSRCLARQSLGCDHDAADLQLVLKPAGAGIQPGSPRKNQNYFESLGRKCEPGFAITLLKARANGRPKFLEYQMLEFAQACQKVSTFRRHSCRQFIKM